MKKPKVLATGWASVDGDTIFFKNRGIVSIVEFFKTKNDCLKYHIFSEKVHIIRAEEKKHAKKK